MNNLKGELLGQTSQSFGFTPEQQEKVEANLRASFANADKAPLRSARPERRAASPDVANAAQGAGTPFVDAVASSDPRMGKVTTPVIRPKLDFGTNQPVSRIMAQQQRPQQEPAAQAAPENTVINSAPPVTPVSTAEYVSIDLPSRFAYYPFKDLYIKPFRVPHLAKLAKADDVDSMQLTTEVVSSVLMTPEGHKDIGFQLAVADFNAILYWLRASSFKKPTMQVTTMCSNPAHHMKVNEGQLPASSLETKSAHNVSKLVTNYLEHKPDPEYFHVMVEVEGESHRIDLRPETMMDAIDMLDDPRVTDPEFQYLARIASYLDADSAFPRPDEEGKHRRWTLQERIGIVEDYLDNDSVMLVLEFSEIIEKFGVDEMVNVKCKECGHVEQAKLTIDARTFLSPNK